MFFKFDCVSKYRELYRITMPIFFSEKFSKKYKELHIIQPVASEITPKQNRN